VRSAGAKVMDLRRTARVTGSRHDEDAPPGSSAPNAEFDVPHLRTMTTTNASWRRGGDA